MGFLFLMGVMGIMGDMGVDGFGVVSGGLLRFFSGAKVRRKNEMEEFFLWEGWELMGVDGWDGSDGKGWEKWE
jgi:hypothetical protein